MSARDFVNALGGCAVGFNLAFALTATEQSALHWMLVLLNTVALLSVKEEVRQ